MAWVTSVVLQGEEADPPMSCIIAAAVWACLFNIAQFLTHFDKTEAGNKKNPRWISENNQSSRLR
jgi:hypothetical protein